VRQPQHNAARLRMLGNLARNSPTPDQSGQRKHRACTATPGSLCARLALEINSLHAVIAETQAEFASYAA
jgi:hypothetical protein